VRAGLLTFLNPVTTKTPESISGSENIGIGNSGWGLVFFRTPAPESRPPFR
jgi:hypothetical protein